MLSYCSYNGCTSKNVPCSKITFFALPRDSRRQIWIENSGNPLLRDIGPNSVRYFCEKHFDPLVLRKQFSRTILKKSAVPYKYSESIPKYVSLTKTKHRISEREGTSWKCDQSEVTRSRQPLQPEHIEFEDTAESPHFDGYLEIEYQQADYIPTYTENEIEKEQSDNDTDNITQFESDAYSEQEDVEILLESNNEPAMFENTNTMEENGNKYSAELEQEPIEHAESAKRNKRKTVNLIHGENFSPIDLEYEDDKHYALSLIGYFQRLPMKKKALAKLKILQYLTALEYNELETL